METFACLSICPRKPASKRCPRAGRLRFDSIDWLGLWALSVAFCAIVLAGIAYFMIGDNIGASYILVGAAAIIAIVVRFGTDRDEARDRN